MRVLILSEVIIVKENFKDRSHFKDISEDRLILYFLKVMLSFQNIYYFLLKESHKFLYFYFCIKSHRLKSNQALNLEVLNSLKMVYKMITNSQKSNIVKKFCMCQLLVPSHINSLLSRRLEHYKIKKQHF